MTCTWAQGLSESAAKGGAFLTQEGFIFDATLPLGATGALWRPALVDLCEVDRWDVPLVRI